MVKIKLGDIIDFKNGKSVKKSDGVIPIYGGNGILGYTDKSNFSHTIVVGRVGAYCGSIYVEENSCWVSDNAIAGVPKEGQDLTYLYYVLKSLNLNSKQIGSSQPLITQSMLRDMVVDIEINIEKQKRIANSISIIDQKIQINNQINQELEAMAKTLYDYWFVQFDFPDQNGKPYKSSGGKMVYHPELKLEIPEGWGVDKIEDIAKTGSGGTPKSTNVSYYSNGEIPWINSGELEQTVITSTSNFITEEGLNNSSAKLFPSGTILVAMYGATAGKVSFLTFEASTNQAICAIMLKDIRMRYYLKNVIEDLYQYLVKLSTGSARDNLSQDMIKNIKVVIPSNDILDRFYDFSNNIIKEITKKQQENEQLTQLRDWILPMLMNGQVKVE
ncbi:DNA specificity domain-containing restriction modification system protein [Streptococcus australis]|uniref:Type I restriction modification DNA specificity domain protein n=1 Tax=Streptococcus australis ATCC 700641 TaxID=888833 RepID=E7SC12_9STRE|nr:restriction endonuclease subunit S [Streptococcus australis]EFV98963.1 type I restriction modification DNA specificity domain protein [Streptococcus australis ATCC 700641]SQH66729.1 DNA specificity domain-containing restriction modification system protein [Streptococcus australis]